MGFLEMFAYGVTCTEAWQVVSVTSRHDDKCGNADSAGWKIMTCSKYAMNFKFSSFSALLSRTPKHSLKGNVVISLFSCFFHEFDKQIRWFCYFLLLAVRCDVIRASSGKSEDSCFVWLKFCARSSNDECISFPELVPKGNLHGKMRGEKSSPFG